MRGSMKDKGMLRIYNENNWMNFLFEFDGVYLVLSIRERILINNRGSRYILLINLRII